jgi:parvulin-like peptidyl-prolyl isomerase
MRPVLPSLRAILLLAAALPASACAADRAPPPFTGEAAPAGGTGGAVDDRPVLDLGPAAGAAVPASAPGPGGLLAAGDDPSVAEVDGVPVRASEVARALFRFDTGRAHDVLNQVLESRIIEADAAALGVAVPREEIAVRVEEEFRARQTEIRVQYGPEVTLEGFLRERYGATPASFRRDLEDLVRLASLRDRLVRFEATREDRIRIRVMVLPDEASARDAARRLREGADFTALARQVSLAPPQDLPSFRREEIRPPELAEELFAMAAGEISRPVRVARDGKQVFEVFKVVERSPARDLPWADLAKEVEKGIRERPVGIPEYLLWAGRARERHGVKFHLEPPAPAVPPGAKE